MDKLTCRCPMECFNGFVPSHTPYAYGAQCAEPHPRSFWRSVCKYSRIANVTDVLPVFTGLLYEMNWRQFGSSGCCSFSTSIAVIVSNEMCEVGLRRYWPRKYSATNRKLKTSTTIRKKFPRFSAVAGNGLNDLETLTMSMVVTGLE